MPEIVRDNACAGDYASSDEPSTGFSKTRANRLGPQSRGSRSLAANGILMRPHMRRDRIAMRGDDTGAREHDGVLVDLALGGRPGQEADDVGVLSGGDLGDREGHGRGVLSFAALPL